MSHKTSTVARGALIGIAVCLEAVVAYLMITSPPASLGAVFTSAAGIATVGLHLLASIFLAAGFGGFLPGGTVSDRASVVVLYGIIAFTLPGAGVIGVAWLGSLLGRGGKQTKDEAPFALGNPLTSRDRTADEVSTEAHLEPLATSLRSFDTEQTRTAVLALRQRAGRPEIAALLKRFRHDPDSELQFFAGSALAGAVERAEARTNVFSARVAKDAKDADAHAGIAGELLRTAAEAATPGDRRRMASVALDHLAIAGEHRPGSFGLASMASRGLMLSGELDAADELLAKMPAGSAERLELLFHRRDWKGLRDTVRAGDVELRPALADAIDFWAGERRGGAA